MIKRAYGFVRWKNEKNSTPPLETQKALIIDYCNKNKLDLVEIFVSTSSPFPNVLDQMLSRCRKKHKISEIVVTSWDKIADDEIDLCLIENMLDRKNIKLIALEEI
jgi:DNA invertase Pin-like site-specific DNA recombinase